MMGSPQVKAVFLLYSKLEQLYLGFVEADTSAFLTKVETPPKEWRM